MSLRVVIVGAGLGGLALAHALVRAGDDVVVLERDADLGAGGYRITLTGAATEVLREHLEPRLYQAIQARSAGRSAFRRFHFVDRRMRVLGVERLPVDEELLLVDRSTLRAQLGAGLEGRIRFGTAARGARVDADGTAVVELADGTQLHADLVVGADGARSAVAASMAGRPLATSCGLDGAAGRTWLDDATSRLVPAFLRTGPALAVGPRGIGMFLSVQDPRSSVVDARLVDDGIGGAARASLVWGCIAPEGRLPRGRDGNGTAVVRSALELLAGWAPVARALVGASDPEQTATFRFVAADPDAPMPPWPAGPVTALGDAVHAMPPTGGQAGATAIRDAGALAARLVGVRSGAVPLGTAIADFHRDMGAYAPGAVRESLAPVRIIRATAREPLSSLAGIALGAIGPVAERVLRARGQLD